MKKSAYGFTIVELLIVIVVIAILAGLSYVGYTNMQAKARDSTRLSDIAQIAKALDLYYIDHGEFPDGNCHSSCPSPKMINNSWSTTSDGSWGVLEAALVPQYMPELPADPRGSEMPSIFGGFSYDYVRIAGTGELCGPSNTRGYTLAYALESQPQRRSTFGSCAPDAMLEYAPSSEHVVVK